jgi:hypothetical protein
MQKTKIADLLSIIFISLENILGPLLLNLMLPDTDLAT